MKGFVSKKQKKIPIPWNYFHGIFIKKMPLQGVSVQGQL